MRGMGLGCACRTGPRGVGEADWARVKEGMGSRWAVWGACAAGPKAKEGSSREGNDFLFC